MKFLKGVIIGVVVTIILGVSTVCVAQQWRVAIRCNDKIGTPISAEFKGNEIYLPISYVTKNLGGSWKYNPRNGIIDIVFENKESADLEYRMSILGAYKGLSELCDKFRIAQMGIIVYYNDKSYYEPLNYYLDTIGLYVSLTQSETEPFVTDAETKGYDISDMTDILSVLAESVTELKLATMAYEEGDTEGFMTYTETASDKITQMGIEIDTQYNSWQNKSPTR